MCTEKDEGVRKCRKYSDREHDGKGVARNGETIIKSNGKNGVGADNNHEWDRTKCREKRLPCAHRLPSAQMRENRNADVRDNREHSKEKPLGKHGVSVSVLVTLSGFEPEFSG